MGSSRLPGKVLSDICGKPMLVWQIERLQRSSFINEIVVATSIKPEDQDIVEVCKNLDIKYYRGSEDDVLDRVASLLDLYPQYLHLECFGDSPLIDPFIIDEFIAYFFDNCSSNNYLSNSLVSTYPSGMEVILYMCESLIQVNKLIAKNDPYREHVGFNLTRFPDLFPQINLKAPSELSFPDLYLEVDEDCDLLLITAIVEHFVANNYLNFSLSDIIDFLKNNQTLSESNIHIERRWKNLRESC